MATNTTSQPELTLARVELAEANAFVEKLHRHHRRTQGHRFSLGAKAGDVLVGVVVVGRPVGGQHQREWAEVTRLCTDGTANACSFLYGAAARAAKALGFVRIQTYILSSESGVSLKATGWKYDRMSHPIGWDHDELALDLPRLRDLKQLWYKDLV